MQTILFLLLAVALSKSTVAADIGIEPGGSGFCPVGAYPATVWAPKGRPANLRTWGSWCGARATAEGSSFYHGLCRPVEASTLPCRLPFHARTERSRGACKIRPASLTITAFPTA